MLPSTLAYKVEDSMNDLDSCSTIKKNTPSVNKREIVEIDDSSQEWESNETFKKQKPDEDSKKEVTDEEKLEKKPEAQVNKPNDDDLIDIMLCAICNEIMHNCVW